MISVLKSPETITLIEKRREHVQELINDGMAISGDLLYDLEIDEIPMLMESIFPKIGLAGFVGGSDIGKSTFLRQLALAISSGKEEFLGFKLNSTFNQVLYVTTEDDHYATSAFLRKQPGFLRKDVANIRFLFDSSEIVDSVEMELELSPVDCVIIDAYSDIVRGDMNQSNVVRAFLDQFKNLAIRYQCLFIFLHHTGKGKQNSTPSKDNVLGSTGFENKLRIMIEFKADPKILNRRHMCVVKGNYVKSENKIYSFALDFDDNMTFFNSGERIPFSEITLVDPRGLTYNSKIIEKVLNFSAKGLSSRKIESQLANDGVALGKSSIAKIVKENNASEKVGSSKEDIPKEAPVRAEYPDSNSYFDIYMNM